MEHLEEVFHKYGQIYNGSAEMVNGLFLEAISVGDRATMKALIFSESPVLSAEVAEYKNSFLQSICNEEKNYVDVIQLLIDSGVNIDKQNVFGETALHMATMVNNSDPLLDLNLNMIKILLKSGANREIRNKDGLTPFQLSLFSDNLDVAEALLKEEDKLPNVMEVNRTERCRHLIKCLVSDRNVWNTSSTNYSVILHFLLLEKDDETFEYIAKKANFTVNAVNHEGQSLMHLVAKSGSARMIRALFKKGADRDTDLKFIGTPLIVAIRNSRTDIVDCLLECFVSVNKAHKSGTESLSPLHYAVCVQNLEIVEKLVKRGANVNALSYLSTPLHLACGGIDSERRSYSLLNSRLLNAFFCGSQGNIYDLPLSVKIVELLLDHGADIQAKNASNATPLVLACRAGKLDIVKLLLSRVDQIDKEDVSILLLHAVIGKNPSIVKLILDHGANVNYRCAPNKILWDLPFLVVNPPSRTPLECALVFINEDAKCKDIIKILVEYGANVKTADPERMQTPLHLVFHSDRESFCLHRRFQSRPATLKFLLECNVEVNVLDSSGRVAFYYAILSYERKYNENTSFSPFFPDLVILIDFIAKMIEAGECVIEKNLLLLEDESARPIYHELTFMKRNIYESHDFSFLNILFKDLNIVGGILKDKNISQVLRDGEYKKNLPTCAQYVENRLLEAEIQQSRVDLEIKLFHKFINEHISVELIVKIFSFLKLEDSESFRKACFVDVDGQLEDYFMYALTM